MVRAYIFDLDTLVVSNNQAWIVDKSAPSIPLVKIPKSEFNLIKNGIYKSQGNKIDFNGTIFWLPTNLLNTLKVKAKNSKVQFSNLAVSLQEFSNKDIIDMLDVDVNIDIISNMKNKLDDIYIICPRQTKRSYESVISKVEDEFKKNGVTIKSFYYISENFHNQNSDDIKFKKMRLLLQHLIGYRTNGNKFVDTEITRYDQVYYYDNDYDTLKLGDDINNLFELILTKTDNGIREVIKEDIKEFKPTLFINKVNDNHLNKVEFKKVIINLSNLIKTFESFKIFNKRR